MKWIDKDLKKPKEDQSVLVTWEGTVYIGETVYLDSGRVKFIIIALDIIIDAKYWMPLPEPAKE